MNYRSHLPHRPRVVKIPRFRRPSRLKGSLTREIVVVVTVAALLSWLLKTFFLQAFLIPSGSMEDTLLTGDRILVNKLVPGVQDLHRGDIVVFEDPGGWLKDKEKSGSPLTLIRKGFEFLGLVPVSKGDDLVKRVIGIGGDHVACCDAQGRLTINNVSLDEPYLYPGNSPSNEQFSVYVPEGYIWVMGDHRADSEDSRAHRKEPPDHGLVRMENVIGRTVMVIWPVGDARRLPRPEVFDRPELQPDVAK